jgi:hypothetical protein
MSARVAAWAAVSSMMPLAPESVRIQLTCSAEEVS